MKVGIVSTDRADANIYLPLWRRLSKNRYFELQLYLSGSLARDPQSSWQQQGIEPHTELDMNLTGDRALDMGVAMGTCIQLFSRAFEKSDLELIFVLGDRYEMFAAACASIPFRIPLAHVQGGEITEGAFDNSFRHCISKLSHLHFVTTSTSRKRLLQMGEEDWRITVSGSIALENLSDFKATPKKQFFGDLNLPTEEFILVSFHPETMAEDWGVGLFRKLLHQISNLPFSVLFVRANHDPGGAQINQLIEAHCNTRKLSFFRRNLDTQHYFSALTHTLALVGNSSSGILEAPSLGTPFFDIGDRQKGRQQGNNVTGLGTDLSKLTEALIKTSATPRDFHNPYFKRDPSSVIMNKLLKVPFKHELITKKFNDLEMGS